MPMIIKKQRKDQRRRGEIPRLLRIFAERTTTMDLAEAILWLKKYQGYIPISEEDGIRRHAFDLTNETVDALLLPLEEKKLHDAPKDAVPDLSQRVEVSIQCEIEKSLMQDK